MTHLASRADSDITDSWEGVMGLVYDLDAGAPGDSGMTDNTCVDAPEAEPSTPAGLSAKEEEEEDSFSGDEVPTRGRETKPMLRRDMDPRKAACRLTSPCITSWETTSPSPRGTMLR